MGRARALGPGPGAARSHPRKPARPGPCKDSVNYICICLDVCICVYVYMTLYMYIICVHICMYICIYVCIYVWICMYICMSRIGRPREANLYPGRYPGIYAARYPGRAGQDTGRLMGPIPWAPMGPMHPMGPWAPWLPWAPYAPWGCCKPGAMGIGCCTCPRSDLTLSWSPNSNLANLVFCWVFIKI